MRVENNVFSRNEKAKSSRQDNPMPMLPPPPQGGVCYAFLSATPMLRSAHILGEGLSKSLHNKWILGDQQTKLGKRRSLSRPVIANLPRLHRFSPCMGGGWVPPELQWQQHPPLFDGDGAYARGRTSLRGGMDRASARGESVSRFSTKTFIVLSGQSPKFYGWKGTLCRLIL